MGDKPPIPKKQHYVPQFLLKGFHAEKKHRVHVFDKHANKAFPSAITSAAAESGFYNYKQADGSPATAELGLAHLEDTVACVINRIRKSESLTDLSPDEHAKLSVFAAIQILRVPAMRTATEQIAERFERRFPDGPFVETARENVEDSRRRESVELLGIALAIAEPISLKPLVLLRAPKSTPMLIGDNPVVASNSLHGSSITGFGLGADGTEIYLPISSRLTLYFMCPMMAAAASKAARNALEMKWRIASPNCVVDDEFLAVVEALQSRAPMNASAARVQGLNSLQIACSHRFIYSCRDDFAHARQMIADTPEFKTYQTMRML